MIKTWRPEIKHLFVFHVQISTLFIILNFLYYQVLILSSTCSKPVAASCEAGQLLTQNPLMVRLLKLSQPVRSSSLKLPRKKLGILLTKLIKIGIVIFEISLSCSATSLTREKFRCLLLFQELCGAMASALRPLALLPE